jgi:hypothetical protein
VPFYSIVADLIDPTMLPWLRVQENLHSWELENSALKDKLRATGQQQEASSARTVLIDALRPLSTDDAIGAVCPPGYGHI